MWGEGELEVDAIFNRSLVYREEVVRRDQSIRNQIPEETKIFFTIFNYSKLNTQHKSNPNWKNTTKNYSPETKNS